MSQNKHITLTELELETLVKRATGDAVRETLVSLGLDVSAPLDLQRDFHFLRETRTASDSIKEKGLLTLVGIMCSGILAALWVGVKELMRQH